MKTEMSFLASLNKRNVQNYSISDSNANTFIYTLVDPISKYMYLHDTEFNVVKEFYRSDFKPADLGRQLSLLQSTLPTDFSPKMSDIIQLI